MIGICGFLRLDGAPAERERLIPMQRALVRCGKPSHAGLADGSAALGAAGWHAMLAVDAGPALYRHPASGCVVVADARLHGRADLARALGLPMSPQLTDAQLIAHAWLRHGEDCAARLDGDFAFAVWDPRTQTMSCARDITGVRPLYVHHAPGRLFAFASSTPALLALPGVTPDINEARIADFLVMQLEGFDHRVTFHQHIERLPPAHQCTVAAGRFREHRYWRLGAERLPGMPRSDAAWADALRDTMEAVIADQLAAAQTTGCMLSGGLDSSSLAVIAADQLRQSGCPPLPTFSSIDSRTDNPETRAIQAMLTLPGLQPHCVDHATTGPVADRLWRQMWQTEEPFDGTMTVLNAQYFTAADAGVAAVLDGVDGDLLFLAGNGHARMLRRGHVVHAWRNARGLSALIGLDLPTRRYFTDFARMALVPDTLRRFRRGRRPPPGHGLPPDSLISAEFAARIDLPGRLERLAAWHDPMPHWDRYVDARETLEHPYLAVGLERYRRVAAAQGIDPLHPFTDRRLLVLCSQLPDHLRMGSGQSKYLLRTIMRDRLPEPVRLRRDKKHVGWAQTQALLEAHRLELLERLDSYRTTVAGFVDPRRHTCLLEAVAHRISAATPMEWLSALNIVQLGYWIEQQSQLFLNEIREHVIQKA